jgi:hypothetical protein
LKWEEGDPATDCPPFRQYVWLYHMASPNLQAEVGNLAAGVEMSPAQFLNKIARDPFSPVRANGLPQYFTINGQSGMMSHFNPYVTMMGRVGEPVVVHILNAGLWTHSMHLHANHMWITSVNPVDSPNLVPNPNPIWVDVYRVDPMTRVDYTVPFMKPPDIGQAKGIGPVSIDEPVLQTNNGHPVWPPIEEFNVYMPPLGTKAKNAAEADVELGQRQSPLCYPMHDHSEPSQTSQGGNYNCGLISGIYFTGDRITPTPAVIPTGFPATYPFDFPMDEDFHMAFKNSRGCQYTEPAAPPLGEML